MNSPSRSKRIKHLSFAAFLLFATISAESLFAVEPLRVIGTGGRMATGSLTTTGAVTSFQQRTPHKLGGPVAEIDLGFMNWAHSTTAEVANSTTVTLNYVWIERASTGQVVPVTFSGARQLVMPSGSTQAYWLADPIASAVWTGSAPAHDEVFWVHVKGTVPTGGTIQLGTPTSYAGAKFVIYNPANDPGTFDTAGAVPAITGASANKVGLPLLFLGRYTGPGHLAVIGLGDSIMDGFGDAVSPVPVISGNGPLGRAAVDSSGNNAIATLNLTRGGEAGGTWVTNHTRQAQIVPFANVVVEEFGTNDIGSSGGSANSAQIIGRLEAIWSIARDSGVQKIVRTKLLPRTFSTSNDWLNKAEQTPNPGWGAGGARDVVNASFATALTNGKIHSLVDTLSAVADPTDDHYWFTNGTVDYLTSDGTHLKPAGNALVAAPLRTALLALTVDQGLVGEVIVDNPAGGAAVTVTGSWSSTTTDAGFYGVNYLSDSNSGKGTKSVRFTPVITNAGDYEVFVRWTTSTTAPRSNHVPVEITSADGVASTFVDQTTDGAQWKSVGVYAFDVGNAGSVLISNTGTTGIVVADAVKFVPVVGSSPGTSFTSQAWTSAPWNAVNGGTSFAASFSPDGIPVTLTFGNPKTGIDVTNPAAPNASTAVTSYFGFEGTGFGVGNSGLGRFDRGESFTLTATHAFTLQQINWREWTGDEVVHIAWTQGGVAQQQVFNVSATLSAFTTIQADANTPVVITNVSPTTANLTGRLRINYVTTALLN